MSSEPPTRKGHTYHDIHISGNARVLLGNFSGQGSEIIGHADFAGQYAHSSLRPVGSHVPRPALEQKIREQLPLITDSDNDESRTVVVWGLGGSGKSHLVLNYIREYRREYVAVFWVEAGQKETIERDYLQIYRLLFPEVAQNSGSSVTIEDAVPAVKNWFHRQKERCLLVLDSADTLDNANDPFYIDVNYYLPDAQRVDTIITTRSSQAEALCSLEAVEVGSMAVNEAAELFRKCSKLSKPNQEIEAEILKVVDELGYLALAITLAGSYVAATPRIKSNIRLYLPEYRKHRQRLLSRKAIFNVHRYENSVLSTWETSFAAVERQSKVAANLLCLLAFFNFDDIFLNLFSINSCSDGAMDNLQRTENLRWLDLLSSDSVADQYDIESSFSILQTYSLVSWREDQKAYTMHKLVHAWGHDRLEAKQQQTLSLAALELLSAMVEECQGHLTLETRLMPHVMANFAAMSRACGLLPGLADRDRNSVAMIAEFLDRLGQWAYEYDVRTFDVRLSQQQFGLEHPLTLVSMNNLGLVLGLQGKYEQAEEMHRQILESSERVLGKEHPLSLTSMNNLSLVLQRQGKYEQAEEMDRQTVDFKKRVLGKEHPDTLTSMNNLALVLASQGKYKSAEEMHRQTLELMERELGKGHPLTLTSMNNLSSVLMHRGKYEQAEEMDRHTVELRQTVLGKEHPDTLTSMNNLALVLKGRGKYEQSEEMFRQMLESKYKVLGREHPDTLTSMNNLAGVLASQGKYQSAKEMYQRTLVLMEIALGKEHPLTLMGMTNLADVLSDQGKHEQSEDLHRRTLSSKETVLGKEHPETLKSMGNLAKVLYYRDKYEQSEELYRRTLGLEESVLGGKHPSALKSMNNLAMVLMDRGKYEQAEEMCRQTVELRETVLGKEHPDTLTSMNNLALVLKHRGKFSEAEKLDKIVSQLRIDQLGADPS